MISPLTTWIWARVYSAQGSPRVSFPKRSPCLCLLGYTYKGQKFPVQEFTFPYPCPLLPTTRKLRNIYTTFFSNGFHNLPSILFRNIVFPGNFTPIDSLMLWPLLFLLDDSIRIQCMIYTGRNVTPTMTTPWQKLKETVKGACAGYHTQIHFQPKM